MRALRDLALFLMTLGAGASVWSLADPTRPPDRVGAARPSDSAEGWTPVAPPARPVLQSLRLGPRPSALIDGHLRQPGERFRGYQLLRIELDAVVLRDEQARIHRILLLPAPVGTPRKEVRP